jgi:hypothetical protein
MPHAEAEAWAVDSEWGFRGGRVDQEDAWEPVMFCAVGLGSRRRLSFPGCDHALHAFLRENAGGLFVAHNAVSEMKYLLRLGAPIPARWFDTFVGYRWLTNRPGPPAAGLSEALHALGLAGSAPAAKKELRRRILHLRFDPACGRELRAITDYCLADCDGCAALYGRLAALVPAGHMAHWSEYLKAVARMELRGIPFDLTAYRVALAALPSIRAGLIAGVNRTAPVYVDCVFKRGRFLAWCRARGIAWPVRRAGASGRPAHSLDKDAFKAMEARHPFIARVKEVRKTLDQLKRRPLAVDGGAGRHRPPTCPFRSITGRNEPTGFVFSGPKWLRHLMVPESPGHVLAYMDYVAQEVGIAAALSGDPAMLADYAAEDCHMGSAIRAGAAPPGATKATHPAERRRFKAVNLGVLYGQTARGISARLGVSRHEAEALLEAHRPLFPVYWRWSERSVQAAYGRGEIRTPCGWRCRVPQGRNERTWMSWPMQAAGADLMRLTVTYLDRQGVRLLAAVHDGFLLSCRRGQVAELRAAVAHAASAAVGHVLPGATLRWEMAVHEGRYKDEDGAAMWDEVRAILGEVADGW